MQRNRNRPLQRLTNTLPVLVPVDGKDADGYFLNAESGTGDRFQAVRRLRKNELIPSQDKHRLTAAEWRELLAANDLRLALAKEDDLASEDAASRLTGYRRPSADAPRPSVLAYLATAFLGRALSKARLVFWAEMPTKPKKSATKVGVGIYCPDFKTAIAIELLLRNAFRVCPRCHKTFQVERPTQMCCSIKCREAHRIARWRASKKTGEKA